jgi:hypothetical protein
VSPGGEPERDETGLPPVDIKVPDDARELDRDVQAYRRELRALRRSERRGRWHRALSKDGVLLPLLACCLILALITGTLLTVFTATSNQSLDLPGPPTSATAGRGVPEADMVRNQTLPNAVITAEGERIPVHRLSRDMLVLVPPRCSCAGTLNWLLEVASRASVAAFVIYTPATRAEVESLYGQIHSQLRWRALLAEETDHVLSPTKVPAGLPPGQLTAILVGSDRRATWVSQLSPRDSQAPLVQALTSQSA